MGVSMKDLPRRWPFELLGVVVLALIVWFLFPFISIASTALFEGAGVRASLIVVAMVVWLATVFLRVRRARAANQGLQTAIVEDAAASGAQEAKLRQNFEEAIEFLKTSGGGKSLYELPWYVIIGPPGSGKTTALRQSGLNFPLDRKFGKDALRGVGGTRNCDWWFTDEAVLLDTAGRYFSQDSHQSSDGAEWQRFLELLAKYRKRQPINGVLVAMSAEDLLTMSRSDHDRHVMTMRRRIDELQEFLRVRVPVYFLVTKCDLVAGFMEFFDEFDHSQRNQVWGMTRPDPADDKSDLGDWFCGEYDALVRRLDEEVFERLARERNSERRSLLFGFPRRMEALRDGLALFLQEVFQPHRFDRSIMLRGVYFTSGTQEGTPIDRLMESIASEYGVSGALVSNSLEGAQPRSFFLHRALREVVFSESGLAGVNWHFEVGRAVAQNAAYVGLLVIGGLMIAGWIASYRSNSDYLGAVVAAVDANRTVIQQPVGCGQGIVGVLPRLEALRAVVVEATRYEEDRPLYMGLGLYQGEEVGSAARETYLQAVNDLLVPEIAAALRQRIPQPNNDPTRLFVYLKGYLMLVAGDHLDRDELGKIVQYVLDESMPGQPQYAQVGTGHFDELLASDTTWKTGAIDESMVHAARASLRNAGVPVLMLSRLALAYGPQHEKAIHLDRELGLGATELMRRRSKTPLAEPIPALYTKAVFDELQGDLGIKLVAGFLQDQWVLDPAPGFLASLDRASIALQFSKYYEGRYAEEWKKLLGDLEVAAPTECQKLKGALAQLTGPTSPLKTWLQLVDTNTHLEAAATPAGAAASAVAGAVPAFGALVESQAAEKPGAIVSREFSALHTSMPTVDELLKSLQAAWFALGDCSTSGINAAELGAAISGLDLAAARMPEGVKESVEEMKKELKKIEERVRGGDCLSAVARPYENEVGSACRSLIDGNYPFFAGPGVIAPGDFGRLFGAGGVLDRYYSSVLASRVEVTPGQWRWAAGDKCNGKIPASFLDQFRQARVIRDVFFADGGQKPRMAFTMEIEQLDQSVSRLRVRIGGRELLYSHGAPTPVPFEWPAESGDVEYSFETYNSGTPNERLKGAWAVFRLFEQGSPEPVAGFPGRYRLRLRAGGVQAVAVVDFGTQMNPIAQRSWRQFRCSSPPR